MKNSSKADRPGWPRTADEPQQVRGGWGPFWLLRTHLAISLSVTEIGTQIQLTVYFFFFVK